MNNCCIHFKGSNDISNKTFLLSKVNKSGKLYERQVKIDKDSYGYHVSVLSKTGIEKRKNKIQIFMVNPMDIETMEINGVHRKVIIFKRHNEYPLILTSNNEILLDLFIEQVNENINMTNKLQYYLNKWSYFMTKDSIRII